MTYAEKLKDPRWQKKRLEILERDKWTCQHCYDKKTTLHIHHKEYAKSRNPWDTENNKLITLCENCHFIVETFKDDFIFRIIPFYFPNKKIFFVIRLLDNLSTIVSIFILYFDTKQILLLANIKAADFMEISDSIGICKCDNCDEYLETPTSSCPCCGHKNDING